MAPGDQDRKVEQEPHQEHEAGHEHVSFNEVRWARHRQARRARKECSSKPRVYVLFVFTAFFFLPISKCHESKLKEQQRIPWWYALGASILVETTLCVLSVRLGALAVLFLLVLLDLLFF
jgi:hypothetical protein